MDIDWARRRIQEAPNVEAISDVLLELLELVASMAATEAHHRNRIRQLELNTRGVEPDLR